MSPSPSLPGWRGRSPSVTRSSWQISSSSRPLCCAPGRMPRQRCGRVRTGRARGAGGRSPTWERRVCARAASARSARVDAERVVEMEGAHADRELLGRRRPGDEVPGGGASHGGVPRRARAHVSGKARGVRLPREPARARTRQSDPGAGRPVLAAPLHAKPRSRLGRTVRCGRRVPRPLLLSDQHRRRDLHLLLLPQAPDGPALLADRPGARAGRRGGKRHRSAPPRLRDRFHRLALVRPGLAAARPPLAHLQRGGQRNHRGPRDALPGDALREEARQSSRRAGGEESLMLPVLFTLTIPPSLGLVVWLAVSAASGAWQVRSARAAGEKNLWKTFATWTAGTAVVLFAAVNALGGQNILHLQRPLAIPIHTYGILVAAGFLVAMSLAARAAERAGLSRDKVFDLSFGILVAAMIGSRILFIIVNWDEYAHDLVGIVQFWKGGLVFYGGVIGAVLFSVWYMRRREMPFLPYADAMGPTVAIGQALGRLGCFSAGCCWGGACDAHYAFAARFPPESLAYQSQVSTRLITAGAPSTIPIHPTQLYEALGCALIFLFLTYWRSRKRFHGELLALYLMLYAPLRAVVETFRGDEERGRVFNFLGGWARHAWWNLSTSELISVGIFAAGVAIYVVRSRRTAAVESAVAA